MRGLRSALIIDTEIQDFKFAQLVFGLALGQYFFTMMFRNGNVFPVMLEVYDLLCDFDFIQHYP